jgi:hypothetical protein
MMTQILKMVYAWKPGMCWIGNHFYVEFAAVE